MHANHVWEEKIDRLTEHGSLGLDPTDAPADHPEPVNHRRMRVGADDERHFRRALAVGLPSGERLNVLAANALPIVVAQHRFEQNAQAHRQPRNRKPLFLEARERAIRSRSPGRELQALAHIDHRAHRMKISSRSFPLVVLCRYYGTLMTDTDLIAGALAGDILAIKALMRMHHRMLYRTAHAILRDDAEAEDAVQEAFVQALRALGTFRGESKLSTWLVRIAANEALMRRRRNTKAAARVDVEPDDLVSDEAGPEGAAEYG